MSSSSIDSTTPTSAFDLKALQLMQDKKVKTPNAAASKAELEKAAKQFEGVFLDLVMKSMRQGVGDSGIYGESDQEKFYQTMLDSEYSKLAGDRQSIGIAQAIVRQMTQKTVAPGKAQPSSQSPAATEGVQKP